MSFFSAGHSRTSETLLVNQKASVLPDFSLHAMTCRYLPLLFVLLMGACAPTERVARAPEPVAALPDVPAQTGPLDVALAYPKPGAPKPSEPEVCRSQASRRLAPGD